MKRRLYSLLTAALLGSVTGLSAQEMPADTLAPSPRGRQQVKEGWSFIPLPDLGYSSDNGLNLGAFVNIYYYGRGEDNIFPNRHHHISIAGCYTTKGAWNTHAYFDTKKLIPGVRMTLAATWKQSIANNFYGYNGVASPYHPELDLNNGHAEAFYTTRRSLGRAVANFQGDITGGLRWMAGSTFRYYGFEPYRDSKTGVVENTLYSHYRNAGLIRADEAAGGMLLELHGGIIFDTRDVEEAPVRGMYGELYFLSNVDLLSGRYHHGKLVAHWRHFIPLAGEKLILAYHLGYQGLIWGEEPFYMLQDISTLFNINCESEGLGSRYTMRGTMYDRILADGYAWANLELRIKIWQFNLFRQHFDLYMNPFFDAGAITDPFRLEQQMVSTDEFIFSGKTAYVHGSAGAGVKLHINSSLILSAEVARAFNPALIHGVGFSFTTNYIF